VTYFTPIFFSIWCVGEAARLYVGYKGNLMEDTPNMAAFLFLTVFPQMLITIYFISMQAPLYYFDKIFSGIMLAFLIVEFILAWRLLGAFIADKTARFSVEYGGVEGRPAEEQTDVIALNEYINEDDAAQAQAEGNEGFYGVEDGGVEETRPSSRRVRTMPLTASLAPSESSRLIRAPSREATLSFGGPGAQPIAAGASMKVAPQQELRRNVGRGSAAPLPPLSASYRDSSRSIGAASADREYETAEQRAARRARDRAIITGQIQPERRRDYDAETREELAQEQARLAMQQSQALDRLSTSRPVLGSLSAAPSAVRIPFTPSLASPQKRE
jgi:hypothetical protein